jgi:hypothetical protein
VTVRRALAVLIALSAGLGTAVAAAQDTLPEDGTPVASGLSPTSATVSARLPAAGSSTAFAFAFGTTPDLGTTTPAGTALGDGPVTISATLDGLLPETVYHVRAVASGPDGPAPGPEAVFTTPAVSAQAAPPDTTTTPVPETVAAAPPPTMNERVVVAAETGTASVQVPGSDAFVPLAEGVSVPVGSVVDASNGTVRLLAATDDSQAPTSPSSSVLLRGSKVEVRQSDATNGLTELVLRGGDLARCGKATAAATRRTRRPRRTLWASDRGGKFRTRGSNSVATVRGTTWRTTDTCRGTTTTVYSGSVRVYDRATKRTYVVRKGHSHLARRVARS